MDSQKSQTEAQLSPSVPAPALSPCQRNKSENASFVTNLRNRFKEFIHAPIDEHKACFKQTIQKVIDSSKKIFGEKSTGPNEAEGSLPLPTDAAK